MRLGVTSRRAFAPVLILAGLALAAPGADARCRLQKVATLEVSLDQHAPLVKGSIEGKPVDMLLDTGAQFTVLTRRTADRLGLVLGATAASYVGIGGESRAYRTRVDSISFGPIKWGATWLHVTHDSEAISGFGALIGANLLFQRDVELHFAEGQVRLFAPEGCDDAFIGYWSRNASVVAIEPYPPGDLRAVVKVELNGKPMRALVDSGATHSFLDLGAARRLGLDPVRDGAVPDAHAVGLGKRRMASWELRLDSFAVADEVVKNPVLTVLDTKAAAQADINTWAMSDALKDAPELVLGADFLRAHRVLLSVSQRLMYFSYLGGPVFSGEHRRGEPPGP